MSIISTITEFVEDTIETVGDAIEQVLPPSAAEIGRRNYQEQQDALQAAQDAQEAKRLSDSGAITAYLALPHRPLADIDAAIKTAQDEHAAYTSQLADLEQRITQDDDAVSPKTVNQHSQLTLSIKAVQGRLARLNSERAASARHELIATYHQHIETAAATVETLKVFEAGEYARIKAQFDEAEAKRQKLRAAVRLEQVTRRESITAQFGQEAAAAAGDELAKVEATYADQLTGTIWKD